MGIMIGSPVMKIGISICEKKEKYDTEGKDSCSFLIKLYMELERKFENKDQKNVPVNRGIAIHSSHISGWYSSKTMTNSPHQSNSFHFRIVPENCLPAYQSGKNRNSFVGSHLCFHLLSDVKAPAASRTSGRSFKLCDRGDFFAILLSMVKIFTTGRASVTLRHKIAAVISGPFIRGVQGVMPFLTQRAQSLFHRKQSVRLHIPQWTC